IPAAARAPATAGADPRPRRPLRSNSNQAAEPPPDLAARAAFRLRPLGRAEFDRLHLAAALRVAGLDPSAVERARTGLELATPRTMPDAAHLASAWLADPEVRRFLQVHDWDGAEWLVPDRWIALVDLAEALDRAAGAKPAAARIAHLRSATEAANNRVDRIALGLVAAPSDRTSPKETASRPKRTAAERPKRP
ncbi:MAG: hypothetical protein H0V73_03540, partial [Chloroflexi bacterium]|nr:hypothetical protein [Chloroflexota bacterium]